MRHHHRIIPTPVSVNPSHDRNCHPRPSHTFVFIVPLGCPDPNSTLRTGEESEENPLVVIANLLDGLDLLKYLPMFEQLPAMGMAEMLNLTEEDLKTMGIT